AVLQPGCAPCSVCLIFISIAIVMPTTPACLTRKGPAHLIAIQIAGEGNRDRTLRFELQMERHKTPINISSHRRLSARSFVIAGQLCAILLETECAFRCTPRRGHGQLPLSSKVCRIPGKRGESKR